MLFDRLMTADQRRRRLLAKAPAGPLGNFLATPFPETTLRVRCAPYLALDLETTGGDPACDEIVSFGWVAVEGNRIDLASAQHRVVQLDGRMSESSAVIHGITDDECARGEPLACVLDDLLGALAGRVLIAHYAETERGFIERACLKIYGARIEIPAVDTLQIALRSHARSSQPVRRGSLRLAALRHAYNLPRYPAHNALSDALAVAELFLAQQAEQSADEPLKTVLYGR